MTTTSRFRPRPRHLALVGVLALIPTACSDTSEAGLKDVSPAVTCQVDDHGVLRAVGSVTNHSSKSSSYFVDIDVTVDGHRVDTRTAVVESVEPGDTAPIEASIHDAPDGTPRCSIGDANRFKA